MVKRGEAASSHKDAAEKFVDKLKDFVDRQGFIPEQVFNCNKAGLFWEKKKPKRTYITREEKPSFYGIYLTFQAVISLHYTFSFYLCMYDFMYIILVLLYHVYITNIYK